MSVKKYRKKPVIVEAIQFMDTPEGLRELVKFLGANVSILEYTLSPGLVQFVAKIGGNIIINYENPFNPFVSIKTPKGTLEAKLGDYIVKGVKGEFYPVEPDIFETIYEPIEEDAVE